MMSEPRASGRTELIRLKNVSFVLHGGTIEDYDALVRALGTSVDGQPFGPMMLVKKAGGRWLVIARDPSLCAQVLTRLDEAGIPAEALYQS
jgi:hypothetical protein